jgi:NAD-reducing hydrogenase large subunit
VHDIHVIDPVSRIEGHARITLHLDADGTVADARFHVTEFRGFEELCRGRPLAEMPALTARTCGICPVSHLLASARATDAIMGVTVPPAAQLQRTLANLGQIVQSHTLSFFHLSAPDLLLGLESDPAERNLFGLLRVAPDVARRGIRLRQFGQEVIASVAGQPIHGKGIVPGGVSEPFTTEARMHLRGWLDEAYDATLQTVALSTELLDRFADEIDVFGRFPSMYLGHRAVDGTWEHHDGTLTVLDHDGSIVVDGFDPARYREVLAEAASPDSYLKVPAWRDRVRDGDLRPGMYRVGPLARVNLAERFGTPLADQHLAAFRERVGRIASSSFHYHHARILEVLTSVERITALLDDPVLLDTDVRAHGWVVQHRGVGASEAPRGTLFHDYTVDDDGIVTDVNLLIATGQNELAMNRTIGDIARAYVTGPTIPEGVLNRIEAGIRAYDPCLSCSTHALGQMPLVVQLVAPDGEVVCERHRGAS